MSELAKKLGVKNLEIFWANCIIEGLIDFDSAPSKIKKNVAYILVYLGYGDLVNEDYIEEARKRAEEKRKELEE